VSRLISTLEIASQVQPGDFFIVVQGNPPIARKATKALIQTAATVSSGQVLPVPPQVRGPIHIDALPVATAVYLNDWLIVDQNGPWYTTRICQISQLILTPTWSVIYQLHFDGANGGTTFADDVTSNAWIETPPFGGHRDVVTSTAKAKFGSGSMSS